MELDVKALYRENVWRIKFHKNTTTMAESYQLLKRTGNRIKYKQEMMLVKSRETSRTLKKIEKFKVGSARNAKVYDWGSLM